MSGAPNSFASITVGFSPTASCTWATAKLVVLVVRSSLLASSGATSSPSKITCFTSDSPRPAALSTNGIMACVQLSAKTPIVLPLSWVRSICSPGRAIRPQLLACE